MARQYNRDDYTVGWVCALPIELAAAQEMLDEEHLGLPEVGEDGNVYSLGRIGEHNIILAGLPAGQTGIASATAVAMRMKSSFPCIRFGLMVGIGGGVPSRDADIRLGDIVVSQPEKGHGGVIQYDFGKSIPTGFERTGFLNGPPSVLLSAITKLRALHDRDKSDLSRHLAKLSNLSKFDRTKAGSDVLFDPEYDHEGEGDCRSCKDTRQIQREDRMDGRPVVHYGTIASGNQVMRHGRTRDRVSSELRGVFCFEMEAAGLMNNFPCLVIRGICDYADSHKNKRWQPYAAGTAAAYAKELLLVIPAADVMRIQTIDGATREKLRTTHYIPFLRNRQFVGRSAELGRLKRKLFEDKDCQKVAISGLGGIGKTQVALQFAYSIKKDRPDFSIFWVQGLSMEAFEQGCMEIARALGIHERRQSEDEDVKILVQRQLCAKSAGKWLLIVDNADDLDLLRGLDKTEGLVNFLPESDDGLTLYTTRSGGIAQYLAGSDVVDIEKMTEQETTDLLRQSLIRKSATYNNDTAKSLLMELEYLPLAITQAGAYVNANKSSISDYLRLLKNTEQDAVTILSTDFGDKTRYPNLPNAVAKTWMITINKILEHNSLAAYILAFISCIEWRAIPYSILPTTHPEARLAGAVGMLCSYSFLEKREDDKLDMHRLVHLATRMWVNQKAWESQMSMAVLIHLSQIFPSADWTNREIWRSFLPHAARIDKNEQCQDTEEKSELCLKVGTCLYVDGRMKEALLWVQKSCKWGEQNLREDDPFRLASQHELARLYQANGQIQEAVKLFEHIVAVEAKKLPKNHPSRLASQQELAKAYQAIGQIPEAVKLLEYVVKIQTETFTEDHPDQLVSQHVLAGAYQANGQIKKAVQLLEHIVPIYLNVFPEDDPSQLILQHELARAYQADGKTQKAIELLECVVESQRALLTEDHPNQLASQHELAKAYQQSGQIQQAIQLLEHVVEIQGRVLAENHPDQLASQHELARAYQDNEQIDKAMQLLQHIIALEAETLAENHPSRLASQHALAGIYQENGQVQKAIGLLEYIVKTQTDMSLAVDHPDQLASQHELARAYQANEQIGKAIQLLRHVVRIQRKTLPEDHPSRLTSQHVLARMYQENGQIQEAVKLLEYVVKIQEGVLAKDHPNQLESQHELARAYQENKQNDKAVQLLESIVKIQEGILGEDHPDQLALQYELAQAYQESGQIYEAT